MSRTPPSNRRRSENHKVKIGGFSAFLTIGFYEDGRPCEIFVDVAKGGSMLRTTMSILAQSISFGLQNNVPVTSYVALLKGVKCEPSSPEYDSLFDFIGKTLEESTLDKADTVMVSL